MLWSLVVLAENGYRVHAVESKGLATIRFATSFGLANFSIVAVLSTVVRGISGFSE